MQHGNERMTKMSYDLYFYVKTEYNEFYPIGEPELSSPTYNLGEIFRKSMRWDYRQFEIYRVSEIEEYIENGISELTNNPQEYTHLEPENKWGTVGGALRVLKSIKEYIDNSDVPNEYLYFSWS